MIPITPIFEDYLKRRDREWTVKVDINGAEYDNTVIVDFDIEYGVTSMDAFELGTANLSRLVLKLRTLDEIPPNAKVIPYVGLSLSNMTWEDANYAWEDADFPWDGSGTTGWLSLGEFYIDNRERINDIWEYECYDQLVFADMAYISELDYPATMQAVWDEVCDRIGYTYDSSVVIDPSYTVPAGPAGYSCRQVMSFIAGANSASVYSGRDGMIKFRRYEAAESPVYDLGASDYVRVKQTNPVKTYTRVVVTYDSEDQLTYEAGTGDDNHTLYLVNPMMTQAMVDDLLATINGMAYVPIELDARGYPQLEAGDRIAFDRTEALSWDEASMSWEDADFPWDGIQRYETVLLRQSFSFKGGLRMSAQSPSVSEQASEFEIDGSLTAAVNRLAQKSVRFEKPYYGVTHSREYGIRVQREDGLAEATLNADELRFKADGEDALWFDIPSKRFKFTGTLEGVDGIFSGTIQGGSFIGGDITIGSGEDVFMADSNGIWSGASSFAGAPFKVNMQGQMIATDGYFTGEIASSSIIGGTITGALIQTNNAGVYPRIEMSESDNILTAEGSISTSIELDALGSEGVPGLIFRDGSEATFLLQYLDSFNILATGDIRLQAPLGFFVNGVQLA